jgi:hypothetical protein
MLDFEMIEIADVISAETLWDRMRCGLVHHRVVVIKYHLKVKPLQILKGGIVLLTFGQVVSLLDYLSCFLVQEIIGKNVINMFGQFGGKLLQHVIVLSYELDLRTFSLLFRGNSFKVLYEVLSFVVSSTDLFI